MQRDHFEEASMALTQASALAEFLFLATSDEGRFQDLKFGPTAEMVALMQDLIDKAKEVLEDKLWPIINSAGKGAESSASKTIGGTDAA